MFKKVVVNVCDVEGIYGTTLGYHRTVLSAIFCFHQLQYGRRNELFAVVSGVDNVLHIVWVGSCAHIIGKQKVDQAIWFHEKKN